MCTPVKDRDCESREVAGLDVRATARRAVLVALYDDIVAKGKCV